VAQDEGVIEDSMGPDGEAAPLVAAFRHGGGGREGFEVVRVQVTAAGVRLRGQTAAVEDGQAWSVGYEIALDEAWCTYRAQVWDLARRIVIELDRDGGWRVDGSPRPDLDGCLDVDLESSACTNTIPVHRLDLAVGEAAEAPAVYFRAADLAVERLEQSYRRLSSDGGLDRYRYDAPIFDFTAQLTYDPTGLIVDYPGIATRAG
jgi:hypothetical protein